MLRLVRKIFSDKSDDFTFYRYNKSKNIDLKSNTGLYIHIPFCTHFCPYCPYFKVRYNKDVAQEYKKALLKEIELYYKLVVSPKAIRAKSLRSSSLTAPSFFCICSMTLPYWSGLVTTVTNL